MKKIIFTLIALCCALSMDAQILKVMKNGEVIMTFKASEADEFVFEEEPIVKVTGITLNRSAIALGNYKTFALTATITPEDATNKEIVWTVSGKGVSVSNSGVVEVGSKQGMATVTATAADGSGVSATCIVGANYGEIGYTDNIEIEILKYNENEPHDYISIPKELGVALAKDKMTRENMPYYIVIYEIKQGYGIDTEYKYVASNGAEGTAEHLYQIHDKLMNSFSDQGIKPWEIVFMYPVTVRKRY